ncbi:ABC transporter substrate-binding protein [Pseudobutyrivibrio sp. MD2005]|uniref:ABC transporter substrate-binding protein n=1 Tax=Pseudobutyrivibrio sp. MD2005 TaxID=1410616 RepID=UPI000488791A|nr:ABC transporter substrate-binding protein [Pseudobutyrivibrio sp. MD2005]
MKKMLFFAAALAIVLSACSFFNKEDSTDKIEYGTYSCDVLLTGGSGKATVESPAEVVVAEGGMTVRLVWSSSNYDYMLVDDTRYDNEAGVDDNSVFTIPFSQFDTPCAVIGDTTAMSQPHEIEYEITVYSPGTSAEEQDVKADSTSSSTEGDTKVSLGNLKFESNYPLEYAKEYSVDFYIDDTNNKYAFITIGSTSDKQYFLRPVSEGAKKPDGISDNIVYLADVEHTYLVSTSVMDMVSKIGAIDNITLSGTKAKDWDIAEAKKLMKAGKISYAGKYSAPDYELLLASGCDFAIENTMIYHNPEVKEKLEEVGIPVMVERSSYETNPLGRLEWIKLYGILYGKEKEACKIFDNQVERVSSIGKLEGTGKKVAFFSINSNGQIVVRKPNDYIASMIGMAGASYVPDDIAPSEENAISTMKITTEDFYIRAVDADILIYNSTIEGEIGSVEELIKEESTLADFKAVRDKKVYCLREGYFQKSTNVAEFIEELNQILNGSFEEGDCFIELRE